MIVAGIDYSMSSPAITVVDTEKEITFESSKTLAIPSFPKKKPYETSYLDGALTLIPSRKAELSAVEHFDFLAEKFVEFMQEHNVEAAMIEDYAYGAKGQVFNIGENGGVLKNKMHHSGISLEVISPGTIKKYATGNGAAKKWPMYEQFVEETKVDLIEDVFGLKRLTSIQSPIDDIIDSFYIARYYSEHK